MRLSTANFIASNSARRTIVVDRPVTVSDLNFDSANAYTLAGAVRIRLTMDAVTGLRHGQRDLRQSRDRRSFDAGG